MPAKRVKTGFLLPEVINPLTSKCLVINVPDDLRHFAAFWGNLQNLMYASNWEGTPEEREEVAQVWHEVIQTARQNWESGECIMPAQFRLNPTSGVIEYQPYGGTGWQSLGDACACPPVSASPSYNPEVTDPNDSACNIATYLIDWLFSKAEDAGQEFEAAADTAAAIDAVFAIFPPAYLVADAVTDMLSEMAEAGVALLFAWLSTDRLEEHQEWLYCKLSEMTPPDMTNTLWDEYKEWAEDPLSPGAGLYQAFLNSLEYSAIDDRARIGSYSSGNCAAFQCGGEWEKTWNFVTEDGSPFWESAIFNGNTLGVYAAGQGWKSKSTEQYWSLGIWIEEVAPGANVTEVTVTFSADFQSVGGARGILINGSTVKSLNANAGTFTETWSGNMPLEQVWIEVDTSANASPPYVNLITEVTIKGTGNNPFD